MIKKSCFIIILLSINYFIFSQTDSKNYAMQLYCEGKFQESKEILDSIIKKNPMDAAVYTDRAVVKVELKDYQSALEDINKSIELSPYSIKAFYGRSIIYCHLGQYEKSIEDASYVISKAMTYSDAYNQRGYNYLMLKDFKKAKDDFDKAISYQMYTRGGIPTFYANRAVANAGLKNFENALSDINYALNFRIGEKSDYILKLFILKMVNRNQEFDDTIKTALNLFPDNIDILTFNLARNIEKIDIPNINADIKKLDSLDCNTFLYHKLLKIYYLLSKDEKNYLREVEILKHPEDLEDGGDLNIIYGYDSKTFMDIYGFDDSDIIFENGKE